MIIKPVNNLGTLIYTLFFGKEVGIDNLGNRYFISKNKPFKKWILYKNSKNPTIIPVNWQLWLTDDNYDSLPIEESLNKKYVWEKNRIKNNTGTIDAYHPTKELNKLQATNKQKKYKNWNPN